MEEPLSNWILQDFTLEGDIPCQIIEFFIDEQLYMMLFNKVNAIRDDNIITEKADELNIDYRNNSYEVKFDLKENFESDNFFKKPRSNLSIANMRKLGRLIKDLLEFHYRNSDANAYFCVAENPKLKRFYDRLAKIYTDELNFIVRTNLGEEGLGYEIRTPSY